MNAWNISVTKKLLENAPYNNSKVGQTFIMKVSSRNRTKA